MHEASSAAQRNKHHNDEQSLKSSRGKLILKICKQGVQMQDLLVKKQVSPLCLDGIHLDSDVKPLKLIWCCGMVGYDIWQTCIGRCCVGACIYFKASCIHQSMSARRFMEVDRSGISPWDIFE